jgi:hypothetical protein
MKKLIIAVAAVLLSAAAYAQGTVQLNNNLSGQVVARVFMPDGTTGVAGYTAQLVHLNGDSVTPLTPTTTFRSTGAGVGFISPAVDVAVPGVAGGSTATLALRAFDGATYETSTFRGQSAPVTVTLGGAGSPPSTPAALTGLTSFNVQLVPEPSTIALALLGGAALLLRRRK